MEVIWPSELATGETEVRDLRPRQQLARQGASSMEQSVPVSTNSHDCGGLGVSRCRASASRRVKFA